jgi:hypothetical protein
VTAVDLREVELAGPAVESSRLPVVPREQDGLGAVGRRKAVQHRGDLLGEAVHAHRLAGHLVDRGDRGAGERAGGHHGKRDRHGGGRVEGQSPGEQPAPTPPGGRTQPAANRYRRNTPT